MSKKGLKRGRKKGFFSIKTSMAGIGGREGGGARRSLSKKIKRNPGGRERKVPENNTNGGEGRCPG